MTYYTITVPVWIPNYLCSKGRQGISPENGKAKPHDIPAPYEGGLNYVRINKLINSRIFVRLLFL